MTDEEMKLEQRKVKALEKIANSIDALTIWFEEIDKEDWSARIQYYLSEWKKNMVDKVQENITEDAVETSDDDKPTNKRTSNKKITNKSEKK